MHVCVHMYVHCVRACVREIYIYNYMDVYVQAGRDSDTHFESEMSYDAQMRG